MTNEDKIVFSENEERFFSVSQMFQNFKHLYNEWVLYSCSLTHLSPFSEKKSSLINCHQQHDGSQTVTPNLNREMKKAPTHHQSHHVSILLNRTHLIVCLIDAALNDLTLIKSQILKSLKKLLSRLSFCNFLRFASSSFKEFKDRAAN